MLDRTTDTEADHTGITRETIVPAKKTSLLARTARGLLQIALVIAILGGSTLAMNQLIKSKPAPMGKLAFKTVYTIKTATAVRKDHQPQFISYGQIEAARKVDLRSLVSGEVVAVNDKLRVGAHVAAGEALVEIDRFNYEGAMREAKANLREAKARLAENRARIVSENSKLQSAQDQLAIAQRDLARARSLRKKGAMTQQQVEARTLIVSQRQQSLNLSKNMVKIENARLGQQEAAIERLEWRLTQAKRNLENTVLKAPFAGIIRSSSVNVGKLVSANDVVVSLYEPDKLEARFTLTNAQFGRLQKDDGLVGRNVTVSWNIGTRTRKYHGKIARIGAEINSSRGGVEVYAALGQENKSIDIRPGAFVEILVPDRVFKNTIKLPEQTVYNGSYVYVVEDGALHKRAIDIVAYDGENIIVSDGLKAGEKVLTTRIAEVSEGLKVREEKPRDAKTDTKSDGEKVSAIGKPSEKELHAILVANKLTKPGWDGLDDEKRQELVKAHRSSSGS